jgi:CheY-like chemotaxis protein
MGVEALRLRHNDADTRKTLDIVSAAAQRGAGIVRQVLSFARGIEGDRAEVQLRHIVGEIEQIVRETFPKNMEIASDLPRDLPLVMGDATQLRQVLMNLCLNSRDAMPEGGRLTLSAEEVRLDESHARLHFEARPISYVVLEVRDSGAGMAPAIVEKIFDPFFTTKRQGRAERLCPSTARSIVKSHGGFISVHSEPSRGSSFKVYIPSVEQGQEKRGEKVPEGIPMGEGELVLVVDDEAAIRDIAKQILESYGYRVLTAGDGTEALALFAQRKADIRVIITDMIMPYMDGAATVRALRKIDPSVRIIASSGFSAGAQGKDAAAPGTDGFLVKPYTSETLLETLRTVLSAGRKTRPT